MWNLVYAIGRVALVALFIKSGVDKLMDPTGISNLLASKNFPAPPALWWWTGLPQHAALGYLVGIVELVLGLLVAIGWQTRITAFALVAFTFVATLIAHDFWNMTGAPRAANTVQFYKNVAIIGGLIMLIATGGGRFSIDRR